MANGFDDLFNAMASVNEEIVSVNAELVLLGERVTILEEDRSSPAPGGGGAGENEEERVPGAPVVWDELSPKERAALWPQFVAWVIWVADRYEVTNDQLPRQCWWLHGAVVEELTALWTSHQSAYAPGEDAGSAPYLWQDALARGIERIGRLWIGTCRNGQHRARHREAWDGDEPYLREFLSADVAKIVAHLVAVRLQDRTVERADPEKTTSDVESTEEPPEENTSDGQPPSEPE